MTWTILEGDVLDRLREVPDESVQCVVTSPPYWGLRDYGVDGQIGLEESLDGHMAKLVEVFREVRRVLRKDGVAWVNYGDAYWTGAEKRDNGHGFVNGGTKKLEAAKGMLLSRKPSPHADLKPKDLIGMAWMLAFALRADGWWLRSCVIWDKPNVMPEAVTDRPTTAHEYVFLLSKSARYSYDAEAIREDGVIPAGTRAAKGSAERQKHANGRPPEYAVYTGTRNARSVWRVHTQPCAFAHFATFPEDLAERCIKAGSSEYGACSACGSPWARMLGKPIPVEGRQSGNVARAIGSDNIPGASHVGRGFPWRPTVRPTEGWQPTCDCECAEIKPCTVLDPFAGSGTTLLVAERLGRNSIGIELNPEYAEMARKRISASDPMATVEIAPGVVQRSLFDTP